MAKNSYQRALILLHPLESDSSGHVRVERRIYTATIHLLATVPAGSEPMYCALLRPGRGQYAAAALGELRSDGRQARLSATVDPRNIGGWTYDDYRLLLVVRLAGDACVPVLYGYLRGSLDLDWARVRDAVNALFCPPSSPAPKVSARAEEAATGDAPSEEAETREEETPPEEAPPQAEIRIEVKAVVPTEASPAPESAGGTEADARTETPDAGAASALNLLDLEENAPWPEDLEAVRALFARESPFTPFPAEGYVFVQGPLPETRGYSRCAIGLRAEKGRLRSVCYALPGDWAVEPPPGLDGYVWRGGDPEGWWAIFLDAETGAEIDAPGEKTSVKTS